MSLALEERKSKQTPRGLMKANVFRAPGKFGLEEKPIPRAGYGDAVVQIRLTTICGTDIHIVKGEYPIQPGTIIGHEGVGVIHELGPGVTGYEIGQRVLVGAITPCGQCEPCLGGHTSQCGGLLGGWKLGNTIDGVQTEFVRIPFAQANLALVPDALSDEDVLLLADIASTGFAAAESGGVRLGDTVAVFAQGPIGLCATLGARLMGASEILAVDSDPSRLEMARRFGASAVLLAEADVVREINDLTNGRGVDVAIEAARNPGDLRKRAPCSSPWRYPFQRRRVFRAFADSTRGLCRRSGRSHYRDHAMPRRQGADAPPDAPGSGAANRPYSSPDPRLPVRRDRTRI